MRRSGRLASKGRQDYAEVEHIDIDSEDDNAVGEEEEQEPMDADELNTTTTTQRAIRKPATKRATKPTRAAQQAKQQKTSASNIAPCVLDNVPSDTLLRIVNTIQNDFERWQTVVGLALAGAFGSPAMSRSVLEPFWLQEAQDLLDDNDDDDEQQLLVGPFNTLAKLREAARVGQYKGTLRLSSASKDELLEIVPQTVPPIIVGEGREARRLQKAARDYAVWAEENEEELSARITASRAKDEWRLNETDLSELGYSTAPNPHYRSAAPMRLYSLPEVVRLSYDKYGGESGLEAARNASQARKATVKKTKVDKHQARRDEITRALAARGLELRGDSRLCSDYIDKGPTDYSLPQIVDIMHEMNFYHTHTDYADIRETIFEDYKEQSGGWLKSDDFEEISDSAKSQAWERLLNSKGRESVANIPNLPPGLRFRVNQSLAATARNAAAAAARAAGGGQQHQQRQQQQQQQGQQLSRGQRKRLARKKRKELQKQQQQQQQQQQRQQQRQQQPAVQQQQEQQPQQEQPEVQQQQQEQVAVQQEQQQQAVVVEEQPQQEQQVQE